MTDRANSEMVQGTLDMLILRTLLTGPAHGHTIAHVIEHVSENVLEVEQGSLYPGAAPAGASRLGEFVLGREREQSQGEVLQADAAGRKQLTAETDRWRMVVAAIGRVLGESH